MSKKATQAQIREAADNFFYTLDWVTGGTAEETRKQAPHAIARLEELAAIVAALIVNPNKVAANNAHLMQRAASIAARVESYRNRYLGEVVVIEAAKTPGERLPTYPLPANVIVVDFHAA